MYEYGTIYATGEIMGWDAIATKRKNKKEFCIAAEKVIEQAGGVDFGLDQGWLDCSACAYALEQATGMNCWSDGWSAEEVALLAVQASWPDEIPDEKKWAVLSAKAFLETCAKIGSGIEFSY